MVRLRIAAAALWLSVVLFGTGLAAGSAMAQTAAGAAAGQPLQLLNVVERSKTPKPQPHVRAAAKSAHHQARHVRLAARARSNRHRMVAQAAPAGPPEQMTDAPAPSVWPPVSAAPPANAAPGDPAAPATPATPAAAAAEATPSQVVVGGQSVQVASPNEVNELDLAANAVSANAETAQASGAPAPAAVPTGVVAMHEDAEAAPKADSQAVAAAPAHSKVGSTAWILQVMAALGGAVTAGSLAWFLIGSTPQRTYG